MNIVEIKDVNTRLAEIGRIKIGKKGAKPTVSRSGNAFVPPVKLDHFLVTTNERGDDGNYIADRDIMEKLGDHPVEIPVVLLYDDIVLNFQRRYAMYKGQTCIMEGDGEKWLWRQPDGSWKEGEEPVKQRDPKYTGTDKCKINGTLSVVIRCANVVGGVWKFRTTGKYSTGAIFSSLELISTLTSGHLAGIPLMLTFSSKTAINPVTGKNVKVNVVNIVFKGNPEMLRERWLTVLQADQMYYQKMNQIENKVRGYLNNAIHPFDEDPVEIIEEFYPEEAERQVQEESGLKSIMENVAKGNPNVIPKEEIEIIETKDDLVTDGEIKANLEEPAKEPTGESAEETITIEFSNLGELREHAKASMIEDYNKKGVKTIVGELALVGITAIRIKTKKAEPIKESASEPTKEIVEGQVEKPVSTGVVEESKAYETTLPPKAQLKVILVEHGLNSEDLRHSFYKQFPMQAEDYLADRNKLFNNIDLFKKKIMLTLSSHIPATIDSKKISQKEKEAIREKYEKLDKKSFDGIIKFYVELKKER